MSEARPRFQRAPRPAGGDRRVVAMAAMLGFSGLLLYAHRRWVRPLAEPAVLVVEVQGDVASPGLVALPAPVTAHQAIAAAGGDPSGSLDRALAPGTRLVVRGRDWTAEPMDELLVIGVPVDVNAASALALEAVPGLGPSRARAIVEDRERHGRFRSLDELDRVPGIGPATIDALRPFLVVGP